MRSRLPLLIAAVLSAGCATAPPRPDAQEVDRFDIEGAEQLHDGDIKDKVLTSASSWVPLIGETQWFDPIAWQADLRRIQRYYEANGYYQARVLEDVVTETKPRHVKLLVRLREGAPARVDSLAIVGLESLPADMQQDVTFKLPIQVGDIFLEDDWGKLKSLLQSRLRELGYAEVSVEGEAVVHAQEAKVDLTVTITPGERYKFGKIFVAQDSDAKVPAKLIADVARPEVKEGQWFSDSALGEAQARVFSMGVFAGAKVTRGLLDRKDATVPVVVDVKESLFRSVRMGGGFGGDLIRQEVRGIFEYTNRNLGFSRLFSPDSRLDRLTFKAKLGVAFLPNVIDVFRATPTSKWGPIWRLYTEYEVPRFFSLPTVSFLSSVDLLRTLDNTYNYDALELKFGPKWKPYNDLTIYPSLNGNGFFIYTPLELRETAPADAIGCPQFPTPCLVGYLDVLVELDRRDNKLEPKQGYFLQLDVAGGVSSTTHLTPFFKVTPEARGYVSFGADKQFTLAGRLKAGTLLAPDNETPIVVRYFSGGANMRGFYQRRLSPQVAIPLLEPNPNCTSIIGCTAQPSPTRGTTLPVGGSGLLEASLEFRWAITENWVVAIFNDWGIVSTQPLGPGIDLASYLYSAVGFGVRYITPLGPVRVDLGFRLPFIGRPQSVEQGSFSGNVGYQPGCFFGLGSGRSLSDPIDYTQQPYAGAPDGLCNFHLSIGEAF